MARALTGEKLEKELLRLEGMLEYEKKIPGCGLCVRSR